MDPRQREFRMLIMEALGRLAMSQGELQATLFRRFPKTAHEVREPMQWIEGNLKQLYELLAASVVLPGLAGAFKPFANALFSGATYKKRTWDAELSGHALAGKESWRKTEQKIFKATLEAASGGHMPDIAQIAKGSGLSVYTARKFGKPCEILLGAVEDLLARMPK